MAKATRESDAGLLVSESEVELQRVPERKLKFELLDCRRIIA